MDTLLADLIALVAILWLVFFAGGWRVIGGIVVTVGFVITGVLGALVGALGFVLLTVLTPFRLAYSWLRIRRLSKQGRKRYRNPT